MKWRKVAVCLVVVCMLAASFRALGHRFSIANLVGLRVGRMALVDLTSMQAFDQDGRPISTDDRYVSDLLHPNIESKRHQRLLKFDLPFAQSVRMNWNGMTTYAAGSNEGWYQFDFPIQDSSNSIPYQIEASSEGWYQVASYSPNNLPKEISGDDSDLGVSFKYSGKVQFDPNSPRSEFRLVIEPTENPSSYEWTTPDSPELAIYASSKLPRNKITRINLERRDYRIVAFGLMAFGAKPSLANAIPATSDLRVQFITAPYRGSLTQDIWLPNGEHVPFDEIEQTHFMPGNFEPDKRYMALCFGIGSNLDQHPSVKILKPAQINVCSTEDTLKYSNGCHDYIANAYVPKSLQIVDMKVGLAYGTYQEVARYKATDFPVGKEPSGCGALLLHQYRTEAFTDFLVKVPPGFESDQFQIAYKDKDGKVHDPGNSMGKDNYVGFQLQGRASRRNEVETIILKSRPYRVFEFKGVHLYPQGSTP